MFVLSLQGAIGPQGPKADRGPKGDKVCYLILYLA